MLRYNGAYSMTTKQCGNCKWWDRDNSKTSDKGLFSAFTLSECLNEESDHHLVYQDHELDCPVFEERKE